MRTRFTTLTAAAKKHAGQPEACRSASACRLSCRGAALTLASVLALSGCSLGLPQAQNDPTKFYILSATTSAATPAAPGAPVLRLRPVEIASYLRARPLIVRRGQNEVDFRDFARWGEPLEQGIARVLREELLASGVARAVDSGGLRPAEAGDAKLELSVRILACEGTADGGVNFHAVWDLSPIDRSAEAGAVHGDYRPSDLKWTPRDNASLAAALSRAVGGLASEIAGAVAKSR
jgi:uncharacterized lipoprotein YmbA